jgi:DNA ligase D-like protein (predicted 3'-phosphoesterase)
MGEYVVQRHRARRLHYDLRLEMDGVLKSWAVPKEPPTEEGVKRLAVQVEDHPLGYEDFEGVIPEGSYGAGEVEIWDRGKYALKERREDRLVFELRGRKLRGTYCLLRFRKGEPRNWLFFRVKRTAGPSP